MSNKLALSLYPTLLDSYYWYKKMGAGPERHQEMIDKLNKVPQPPDQFPEAAKKGVQFESLVNDIAKGGTVKAIEDCYCTPDFVFTKSLVDKMAHRLKNAANQQKYVQGFIDTPIGKVKMYGFIDFQYPDKHIDLKTCGVYKSGKYAINNQHKTYPIIDQLNGAHKDSLYYITDFRNTFIESYPWKPEYQDDLVANIMDFHDNFLLPNKELITHPKIWGLADKI